MTTFQEKLDALPEMPKGATYNVCKELAVVTFSADDMGEMEDALRARLDLLLETSRAFLYAQQRVDEYDYGRELADLRTLTDFLEQERKP
jgi:hypothetical protein